jgi:hypothetical protein
VSAIINAKVKPLEMRKMVGIAAVVATAAFASVFVVVNYLLN